MPILISELTLLDSLARHVAEQPDKVVYTFISDQSEPQDITFAELDAQTRVLAARLLEQARPGERALLLYPSGLAFIIAFVACLRAGITAVPSSTPQRSRSLRRVQSIVADCEPSLILTESGLLSVVEEFQTQLVCGAKVVATDLLLGSSENTSLPEIAPDDVAFIQYTSGSTGTPKGVVVTHGNLLANEITIQKAMELSSESVFVSWLPIFHDMGLVGKALQVLFSGGRSVLMAPQSFLRKPVRWLQAITEYRGTCAVAPNFGWDHCARLSEADKVGLDLSSLVTAGNGAEPVRAATLERFGAAFAEYGFRREMFFPCYGMAETTLFVSGGPGGHLPSVLWLEATALEAGEVRGAKPEGEGSRALVGCGVMGENIEVVIVHPETREEAASEQVGEIWIGGPSVARGYWKQAERTEEVFGAHLEDGRGPFLRTGDLGFLYDRQLFVTGRLKDLLIIRGRNLYPQDVEATVERVWDWIKVNTCAAFALERDGSEQLALVVEADRSHVREARAANSDPLPELETALAALRQAIGEEHETALHTIILVKPGSFPRTTSGKVQRSRCRDLLLRGELDVVYSSTLESQAPTPNISRQKADEMMAWFRDYAARRLNSRLMDERRSVPPSLVLDLGNRGFFGQNVPEIYGGMALNPTEQIRIAEQVAGVDITLTLLCGINNGLGLRPLVNFGSETQKQKWLPSLAAGRQLASFALTEAGAGSNPKALASSAVRVAGGWRVNAEKKWIGLASWAGLLTFFVQAYDESGHPLGLLALLVSEDTPGLSHGEESLTMGVRGIVQNTVFLRDAFIPDESVLGEPGQGFTIAHNAMMFCRLGIAAIALGGMKRCAQLMARYAERREVGTGRLLDNPVTRTRLGDLGAAINAVETLIYGFSGELDAGQTLPDAAYIAAKITGTELLGRAADDAIQLLGGRGYEESNALPQLMRDARLLRIFEGPTETLTMHLGMTILQRATGWREFIAITLGAPELGESVITLGETLRAHASNESEAVALQAAAFSLGEVAVEAILLATAQKWGARATTIAWSRRRYETKRAAALASSSVTMATPEDLLEMVGGYTTSIGDVEQSLPGEQTGMDVLLRRDKGLSTAATIESTSSRGAAAPTFQPLQAIPVAETPQLIWEESPVTAPLPSAAPASSVTLVHDIVLVYLRRELKMHLDRLDTNAHFSHLGLDSVGLLAIASELEDQTGHYLPEEVLYQFGTINAMAAYLDGLTPHAKPTDPLQSAAPIPALVTNSTPSSEPVLEASTEPLLMNRYRQGLARVRDWEERGYYFYHSPISEQTGSHVVINGKQTLMLGSYSYLGLVNHPEIVEASVRAVRQLGTGAHGVRVLAGTTSLHQEVEAKLAAFMGAEDAIVYSSGFMTNLATISTLVGRGDCVIGDEWNHASIVDGCKASGADFLIYAHEDMAALEARLKEVQGRQALVVADAVFSMDGDVANLPEISRLCRRFGALLMVDEAHSLGAIGKTGRGIQEHFNLAPDAIDVKMGTLSKSIPAAGGFVAGSGDLICYLRHSARGYLFSSALPASQLAVVSAALDLLEREPERVTHLHHIREHYVKGLHALGFDTLDSTTPIIPIACHTEEITLEMTRLCREAGLYVVPVFFPAVPLNAPRLRTCVMATHTEEEINFALKVLEQAGRKTGLIGVSNQ